MSQVRVRFAPSPTGYLHVGGARTALYNYLFAKKNGGKFILRVEDTDLERSTEESLRYQINDLAWLGLEWDEGPDPQTLEGRGDFGPYLQSERRSIYQEHADQLLERGMAYYDFRTDEELEAAKQKSIAAGGAHQVPRPDVIVPLEEARRRLASGEQAAIRFWIKNPKDYKFKDLIRDEVQFQAGMLGDFVIIRSNGMPVYNFCCAIDDALMKITHVFRAEEHLSNTLRQLIIYEAFEYEPPQFGHLSIILGPDRQKLSKRHGATSCNDFRERGYLPEALKNFMALLGWSSPEGQEILTEQELMEQFSTDRLNPAPAVFDEDKLRWVNATHLRQLPTQEIWSRMEPFLSSAGLDFSGKDLAWKERAIELFKTSMETLADAAALFEPLADEKFAVLPEATEALGWESTGQVLKTWSELLSEHPAEFMTSEEFGAMVDKVKERANVKGKFLFMPIRVAVIGKPHGAELKDLVPLMPIPSLQKRVQICLEQIKGS